MNHSREVPWIPRDRIAAVAEKFLRKYNPSFQIPVDIEYIVEFDLKMDIVPVPGLKDALGREGFDIDGFIGSRLNSISVDSYVYDKFENRYRFTLAHEVGHALLHRKLYMQYKFTTIEGWISDMKSLPQITVDRAEWQAKEVAGLILVPRRILEDEFIRERNKNFRRYSEDAVKRVDHLDKSEN